MFGMDDPDIPTLVALYNHIGGLLCDELGHDWEERYLGPTMVFNTATNRYRVEKCDRCGETRRVEQGSSTLSICGVDTDSSGTTIRVDSDP